MGLEKKISENKIQLEEKMEELKQQDKKNIVKISSLEQIIIRLMESEHQLEKRLSGREIQFKKLFEEVKENDEIQKRKLQKKEQEIKEFTETWEQLENTLYEKAKINEAHVLRYKELYEEKMELENEFRNMFEVQKEMNAQMKEMEISNDMKKFRNMEQQEQIEKLQSIQSELYLMIEEQRCKLVEAKKERKNNSKREEELQCQLKE